MKQVLDIMGREVVLPIGPTTQEFRESMEASGHFVEGSISVERAGIGFDVAATFRAPIQRVTLKAVTV